MIQFGDLAYEKEEFFVTYEGLIRLSSPRFPSGQVGVPAGMRGSGCGGSSRGLWRVFCMR